MGEYEQFKVGQKVKRIEGSWNEMEIDDIATITDITDNGKEIHLKEYCGIHAARKLVVLDNVIDNYTMY